MQANWTRGNGNAGLLVVARQGSAVNADPSSGTSYTANATFGNGEQIGTGNFVVYNGTGTNVNITALTVNTAYHYAIYEYNSTGVCYNLTKLTGNATTTCTPPSTQATSFSASNIQNNQIQVDWVRGNGDNVMVVARSGSAVNADPTSGNSYTANAAFGGGSQIGTGNYVVYNGSGTSVTITALSSFTAYHFAIYEYNSVDNCYNSTELTGNATTLCSPPTTQATSFSATNIQPTQMRANWVRGNGTAGVLVVARQGSPVDADPSSGTTYTANAAFGSGTQIGAGNYVVYKGTGTNVTITALTSSSTYYYAIYEFNTSGICFNLTELTGNATTLCSPPTSQATSFTATNVQSTQMQANWVRGNGTAGVLIVARQGSAVNADPSSGTSYSANAAFGSGDPLGGGFIVYIGTGTNVTVTSLNAGTTYHFAIYEYNSSGVCYNTTELTGNATTLLANDNCSGATSLTVYSTTTCGGSTNGTTVNATNSMVTGCAGTADDDVWYSFVATSSSHTITVVGASFDVVVDLRSGACDGSNLACADATSSGTEVIDATGLITNATYLIRVYGFNNGTGSGTFSICVTTPPPPYFFQTKQSGDWSAASTWESSTVSVNGPWSNATAAPTISDLDINVKSSHTVTISTGTVTTDQLVIASGSTLDITGGTLSIANGTGNDVTVFGTLKCAGTISNSAATLVVENGGKYQHNNSSLTAIPSATWNSGSTCEVIGYGVTSGTQTGVDQNFHHFTWNCPSQSGNTNFTGAMTSLGGNFEVNNTGSGSLRLTGGTQTTLTVSGYLKLTNGTLDLSSGASNTIIKLTGDFEMSGGTLTESSNGSGTIEFNGTNQSFIKSAGTISNTINFKINSGSTTDFGSYILDGSIGTFNLSSGGTIKTSNSSGINGAIVVGGTKTFSSLANFEFQGTSTGTFTTTPTASTVNNLTINNSGGTVNLGQTLSVVGTLNLIAGSKLNLNFNPLTVNTIIGGSSSSYIIAESPTAVIKASPFNFTYPIGTSDNYYMPLTFTGTGTYSVYIAATASGLSNPSYSLTKQWEITRSGGSGNITNTSFQWPTDLQGNNFPSSLYLFKNTSGTWTNAAGPVSAGGGNPNTASFSNVPCCSGFVPGGQQSLPVELGYFQAKPTQGKVLLDWRTYSETNNSHFSIEKSTDGAAYQTIGRVEGKGFSNAINDYNFVDEHPAQGINYYRLKQVDFDGNFEYSKVVSVFFGDAKGQVQLYPTLANESMTLRFPAQTDESGSIQIFDYNGKMVKLLDFEPEQEEMTIPTNDLPSGAYFLKVQSSQVFETLRFIRI